MVPVTGVDSLTLLRMKISCPQGSWLENYCLGPLSYASALPIAAAGCWFRKAFFGNDVSLFQASISQVQPPVAGGARNTPDRKGVSGADLTVPQTLTFPWYSLMGDQYAGSGSGSHAAPESENDPFVGPMIIRETPTGNWSRLILRGLPDAWIKSMTYIGTGSLSVPDVFPAPFATYADAGMPVDGTISGTLLAYQRAFMTWLLFKTFWYSTNRAQLGPLTGAWLYQSWDRFTLEGVRKLNLGASWGQFKGHATTGK